EDGPADDRARALPERQRVAKHVDRDGARAEITGAAHPGGGGTADRLGRDLPARTEPDHHDPLRGHPASRVEVAELPRLALELLFLEDLGHLAAQRAVEVRQRLRQPFVLRVRADDQHVAVRRVERLREQRDLHPVPPPVMAAARRTISTSPSGVSYFSISAIGTHPTSAPSLPA